MASERFKEPNKSVVFLDTDWNLLITKEGYWDL